MIVPKKRTTRAAQGKRRAHQALKPDQLVPAGTGAVVPRRLKRAATLGLLSNTKKA